MAKFRKSKGFTLVELLIVIIVIGILAGAMMLVSDSIIRAANASKVIAGTTQLKTGVLGWYTETVDVVSADRIELWSNQAGMKASLRPYVDDTAWLESLAFTMSSDNSAFLVGVTGLDPDVANRAIKQFSGTYYSNAGVPLTSADTNVTAIYITAGF